MVASHSGFTDIAVLLKERGADPSQRDEVVTLVLHLSLYISLVLLCYAQNGVAPYEIAQMRNYWELANKLNPEQVHRCLHCSPIPNNLLINMHYAVWSLVLLSISKLHLFQFSSRTPRQIIKYSMRTLDSVQRRVELGPLFLSIAAESKAGAGIISTSINFFRKMFPVRT